MKYFKQFSNGTRSKAEYIIAIVISAIILFVTICVMPIIIRFVSMDPRMFKTWAVFIILSIGLAGPLGTYSALMIISKKRYSEHREKARERLTSEFRAFKYKGYNAAEFERRIIRNTSIKFEAKIDEKNLIIIKAMAPDGGVVHTEETYDYEWFNNNFYPAWHKF